MTRSYSLYSCLASVTAWPALADAIHARLEPFAATAGAASDISLQFEAADAVSCMSSSPQARRVYDFPGGEVAYDDALDQLTISVGDRVRAVCEPAAGLARVFVASPQSSDLYLLSHPVLSVVLMELLKRRGYYPLHAAGLALEGLGGVLIAGTSGAGKSTLSVALARRGFSFLSDDTVYLEPDGPSWVVRAFPDQIDLCADAPELFPELREIAADQLPAGWHKRQIRAETVYAAPIAWDMRPRTLIFPRVSGAPRSVIHPLSHEEALFELAPNVLLTDATAAQQHLDALAGVVSQCSCYRLDTGRDLDDAVAVIRGAMAA